MSPWPALRARLRGRWRECGSARLAKRSVVLLVVEVVGNIAFLAYPLIPFPARAALAVWQVIADVVAQKCLSRPCMLAGVGVIAVEFADTLGEFRVVAFPIAPVGVC